MKKLTVLSLGLLAMVALTNCNENSDDFTAEPTIYGTRTAFHNGTVQSFVTRTGDGTVHSIGVRLSESALEGLPTDTGSESMAPVGVPLPAEAAITGIDHVEINWNPQGHIPEGIYTVPHFDLHFYLITLEEQAGVVPGPDTVAVDPQFIPTDYISTVAAEPNMGVHYVDTTAAEFTGQPFTSTFIYGFYHGQMAFLEPMFTRDLLLSKESYSAPIKQPRGFQNDGYYPANYRVSFDSAASEYVIVLNDLRAQVATQP